jgi:hypothetical protein
MKKLLSLSLLFLLIFFGVVAITSAGDLKVNVACPRSVAVGSELRVSVSTYNESPDPVSFSRAMVGLTGNSAGIISGLGLWGPYQRSFSVINIAPHSPGPTGNIKIVDAVPLDLAGTMAALFVNVLNSDGNKVIGSGGCIVNVR